MTTDTKIRDALEESVAMAHQNRTLANKLIRWFDAIASGNEDIADMDLTARHLELLYGETRIVPGPHDGRTGEEHAPSNHEGAAS